MKPRRFESETIVSRLATAGATSPGSTVGVVTGRSPWASGLAWPIALATDASRGAALFTLAPARPARASSGPPVTATRCLDRVAHRLSRGPTPHPPFVPLGARVVAPVRREDRWTPAMGAYSPPAPPRGSGSAQGL